MYNYKIIRFITILCVLLSSVFAMGETVSKVNSLEPGMTIQQVKELLGEPQSTQFIENKLVYTYLLKEKGGIDYPHYLVFDGKTKLLEGWVADTKKYEANKQQSTEASQKYIENLWQNTKPRDYHNEAMYKVGQQNYLPK